MQPKKKTAIGKIRRRIDSGLGRKLATDRFFQGTWVLLIAVLLSQAAIMLLVSI
jgi:hypothetical protein